MTLDEDCAMASKESRCCGTSALLELPPAATGDTGASSAHLSPFVPRVRLRLSSRWLQLSLVLRMGGGIILGDNLSSRMIPLSLVLGLVLGIVLTGEPTEEPGGAPFVELVCERVVPRRLP